MSDAVWISIVSGGVVLIGQIITSIAAAKATKAAREASILTVKNKEAIDSVHTLVNGVETKVDKMGHEIDGKMSELLKITGDSEHAKGVLQEKERNRGNYEAKRNRSDSVRKAVDNKRQKADNNREEADIRREEADIKRGESAINRDEADLNRTDVDDKRIETDIDRQKVDEKRVEDDKRRNEDKKH